MKVWYDTEFLEDGKTIELISIGMVREDGLEYYAVNKEMPWHRIQRHAWLTENVVPHLPTRSFRVKPRTTPNEIIIQTLNTEDPSVKRKRIIRDEVEAFLEDAARKSGAKQKLELWSWYAAYDHVALCQLWGPMVSKPYFVPHYTNDIKQEFARLGDPPYEVPEPTHNALDDAHYHKKLYNFITKRYEEVYKEAVIEAMHPEIGHWCPEGNLHSEKTQQT